MEPNTVVDTELSNQPLLQWVSAQNSLLDESTCEQAYRFLLESVKEAGVIIASFIGINIHLDYGLFPFEETQQMYFKAIYRHSQTYELITEVNIYVFQIVLPVHVLGYKKIQCLINDQFVCFSLGVIGNLVNRLGYEIFNSMRLPENTVKIYQQNQEAQNDALEAFESLLNTPVSPMVDQGTVAPHHQIHVDRGVQKKQTHGKRGRPKKKRDNDPDYTPRR